MIFFKKSKTVVIHYLVMHIVMRLWAYEAAFPHYNARRCEVLHPVTPLELITDTDLSLHLVDCKNRFH